ncbi:sensor histidine kinase [Pontibacter beigongshangensis]|uniref:sensor histidine kinase n=1 Tax=Pontibacter beigongshangensis TaxID=2574733 RepID=UPI001F51233A|nr:ATP-binding protein [Pontibacter beigongshangensis]
MNRKIAPVLLLIASLLCFFGTAALHFNFLASKPAANYESVVAKISERVAASIDEANRDARHVGNQLVEHDVSFSRLLQQTTYPTFVYKQDRLVFWSDHTIIPDLDYPPKTTSPITVRNAYGAFVVVPHRAGGFDILVFIPLQIDYRISNDYLSSGLQKSIFGNTAAALVLEPVPQLPHISTSQNQFLFSLDFGAARAEAGSYSFKLLLFSLGVLLFVLFAAFRSRILLRRGKHNEGIFGLLILLITFRFLLLVLNLPFRLAEIGLFDPSVYASSFWSPSVGDLAINMLMLGLLAWAAAYLFGKNEVTRQLKTLPQRQVRQLITACFVAMFLLLGMLYQFYYGIYHNSPLVLDISQSLDITKYKFIIYGVMFVHTMSLCVFTFILATVVSVLLQQVEKAWAYKVLWVLTAGLLIMSLWLVPFLSGLVVAGAGFWVLVVLTARYRHAVSFPYRSYLFVFLVISISALTGATALYTHYQNELKEYKQKFGRTILADNDVAGEYLLDGVAAKIATDPLIQLKMKGPYVDPDFIRRKISKQYLRDYFDKYETSVLLFDSQGLALESADSAVPTLHELLARYNTPQTRTEYKDLFLVRDPARFNTRTYLKVIQVPINNWQSGTIILQLSLKKLLPNSVVPELLVDQKNNQPFRADMLSYALYDSGKLSYSEGDYDYATNFSKSLLNRSEFYRNGTTHEEHHHLGIRDEESPEQVLIITTEQYGGRELLSNFSFLFLFFTAGIIVIVLLFLLLQRDRFKDYSPNFSTKIQIFLNFGILLPLLLVSIVTASLVTASYQKDLMRSYEQRGEAVQHNLRTVLSRDLMVQKNWLLRHVMEVASISEADINVYNRHGRLLVTSQPLIFEAGLLSQLINPEAFAAISERQALRVLLDEQAGNLTFNAVYLPLHEGENSDQIAGFIGIPFFNSEKQLDLKLIELITTIMNIFTVMFMMFIVLTFFASRALTVPLRMLANKLKQTSLTGKNEMLAYEGADEIGMLVQEYNRMLLTLEQNKIELAMREKEAAWREMARQVAHEIKNPLTPMKLSLQYLQKAIAEKKPNTEQLIDKISHTLITQINILSDIATSFSNFTSMPEPKAELMNVAEALRRAVDLHHDTATASMTTTIPTEPVMVLADESLMVRSFNNLLLNAIQAVPTSRQPQICVSLAIQPDQKVLISIKDNGNGIPADIRNRVFIPNFSTKYTGSGIGLAVAKKGIENAGGSIWFETEEDKGTTFFISLPLAQPI